MSSGSPDGRLKAGRSYVVFGNTSGAAIDLCWPKASNTTIDTVSYEVWNHTSYATVYVQSGIQVI